MSSGISENIDEISTDDLTGSSLSDQQVGGSRSHRVTAGQQTGESTATLRCNPETIDQLLQRCRTSTRGQGVAGSGVAGGSVAGGGVAGGRPKSEQMNAGQMRLHQHATANYNQGDALRFANGSAGKGPLMATASDSHVPRHASRRGPPQNGIVISGGGPQNGIVINGGGRHHQQQYGGAGSQVSD